jgi:hypothetical protein
MAVHTEEQQTMAETRFKGPGEWHTQAVKARQEELRDIPVDQQPSMPDWTSPEPAVPVEPTEPLKPLLEEFS